MSKLDFKKIVMVLATSTVFSSCFVYNVTGMESKTQPNQPTKEGVEKILKSIERLIDEVYKLGNAFDKVESRIRVLKLSSTDPLKKEGYVRLGSRLWGRESIAVNDLLTEAAKKIVFISEWGYLKEVQPQIERLLKFKKHHNTLWYFSLDVIISENPKVFGK